MASAVSYTAPTLNSGSIYRIEIPALRQAEELRRCGLEPYAYRFDRTHFTTDLQAKHEGLENGEEVEEAVAVAGRVMARRVMGKLAFLSIRDDLGQIQVSVVQKWSNPR